MPCYTNSTSLASCKYFTFSFRDRLRPDPRMTQYSEIETHRDSLALVFSTEDRKVRGKFPQQIGSQGQYNMPLTTRRCLCRDQESYKDHRVSVCTFHHQLQKSITSLHDHQTSYRNHTSPLPLSTATMKSLFQILAKASVFPSVLAAPLNVYSAF